MSEGTEAPDKWKKYMDNSHMRKRKRQWRAGVGRMVALETVHPHTNIKPVGSMVLTAMGDA